MRPSATLGRRGNVTAGARKTWQVAIVTFLVLAGCSKKDTSSTPTETRDAATRDDVAPVYPVGTDAPVPLARKLCEALLDAEAEGLLGNDGLALVVGALTGERKQGVPVGPTLYFDVDRSFRHGGHRQSTADARQAQHHVANIVAALIGSAR